MPRRLAPALAACALLAAPVAAGCGAAAAPPRSPLADPSLPATPAATIPAAATATPGAPDAPATAEAAIARALDQLAEWLALPVRDFALVSAEPTVWPDTCVGVARPGDACAQVATPGLRIVLRDALGAPHAVHSDSGGWRLRWAGEQRAHGTIESVDARAGRLTLRVDGRPLVLRLVPGSAGAPDAAAVGRAATAAYDPTADGRPPALAWLVLDPPS